MNCPKCGSSIGYNIQCCPKCGFRINYGGNTEFYQKAAISKLTLKDVFSDVFKHHNKKDGERMFMAGTSLSTPKESEMLSEWRKPWLFAWVGGAGFIFLMLMYLIMSSGGVGLALIPFIFVGATIVPLAVLLFFWEMNIPRNIPIYSVILMFLIGGAASLIFTVMLSSAVGHGPSYWAPLTEEPAKLIALCLFLRKPKNKYILNGVLIGAAIGTGFSAIESMAYAIGAKNLVDSILYRGILSPGGHIVWAGMYGGALAMVKGSDKLEAKHFTDKNFLTYFGIAFLLHFLWNMNFGIMPIPIFLDLKFLILIIAAWAAILSIIKKGIQQVLNVSTAPALSHKNAYSPAIASSLMGISGLYKDCSFPLSGGTLIMGRDSKKTNIVFSTSTPGISSVHCELRNEGGKILLVDRDSSYGTFLENGTKLIPNQPYVLNPGDKFYLANHNNEFQIL